MTSLSLPALSGDQGLADYLREVRSFPLLSVEEEIRLAQRLRDTGDVDAAHRLVTSHLRLVVKIASQYRKFSLPFEDLISEGTIGLMKAVRKFDPDKGYRLSTYAMWWIKAEIMEFVLKSWSMVRIGSITLQKKLFYNLHRAKRRLQNLDAGSTDTELNERIAKEFNLPVEEVVYLGNRLEKGDISLDQPANDFEDGEGEARIDRLADDRPDPEYSVAADQEREFRRRTVETAMADLPDRDREIIRARWLNEDGETLETLGERFGVSRERIRQIEERALKKIKARVSEILSAAGPDQEETGLLAS